MLVYCTFVSAFVLGEGYNSVRIQRTQWEMRRLTNKLINTICHIVIDGQAQEKYYLATHLVMLLQTLACIADPRSTLYLVLKWADPSTYLPPSFSIVLTSAVTLSFLLALAAKLIITEPDEMLLKPNTLKIYMGNLLLHLQMLCKTAVLSPLIRSALLELQNSPSGAMCGLGMASLGLYLGVVLPISLYNTSNTFVLTPQLNKKLNYINIYLVLNLFRVVFAVASALDPAYNVPVCALFFLIFAGLSVKQPVFAYSHEKMLKGMISSVAYLSLCRLLQLMQEEPVSLPLELVGMGSFIALVDWISLQRVSQILKLQKPTIHQIKILLFLIYNIQEYIGKLEFFILKHHQLCSNPLCHCPAVLAHLSSPTAEFSNQKIWYEFIISYIQHHYCLQEMEGMAESEMKLKVNKYQHIVIDLAEIHLFKLGQLNSAYYIVNNFKHLLEEKGISFLSFRQKKKIINYYMQEEVTLKYKTEGVTNTYADNYMHFQIEYERYRKMLLRSAHKTAEMWEEMNKREPDDAKLHKCIKVLEKWHGKIRKMYQSITSSFEKSTEILESITNDYYLSVLNISEKSQFHVIQPPKFQNILSKKQEKVEKISENMQSFSFNSETPMCFVSVDENSFGQIVGNNYFFNETMNVEFGKIASIEDFMIPEMREAHRIRMKKFIQEDCFSLEHKNGFMLNTKGKLVFTKILVQIMPSILEGLRYVFFLKKLMPKRKILGLKNNLTIAYTSQSFDDAFQLKIRKEPIVNYMTQSIVAELKEKKEAKIVIQEHEYFVKHLHGFTYNDLEYLFVEFYEEDDVLMETKYNLLGEKIENTHRNRDSQLSKAVDRKDSVISKDSGSEFNEKSAEKSDLQEKSANDKLKKVEESICNIYSIIVDDSKKKITRRVVIFILVLALLYTGSVLTSVFLKRSNASTYLKAATVNTNYNVFMLMITRAATYLKLINLNAYQNETAVAAKQFAALGGFTTINKAMDDLVVNFNISLITQTWKYFACNANNGTFTVGSQNNFLTVSDYLQNPITNLIAASIKNFSFPIAIEYLPTPLTSNQCQFLQLTTNSIYISLPKYRNLKDNTMNPILYSSINTKLVMLIVFLVQIVISGCFLVGMLLFNKRVTELKNCSYRLFQSLSKEMVKFKENKCREFLDRYTQFDVEERFQDTNSFLKKPALNSEMLMFRAAATVSKNLEKTFEDHTERELDFNQNSKVSNFEVKDLNLQSNMATGSKKQQPPTPAGKGSSPSKKSQIFAKSTIIMVFLKYLLPAIPLIVFSIIFGSLQIVQVDKITNFLQIQQKIQTMQQDINMIRLYAIQYGTYSPKFEQYQSIPGFLSFLIKEMYSIERSMVGMSFDLASLPLTRNFINDIGYSNICDMFAQGAISPSPLANITNSTCLTIADKILTKGYYSALINYLQSVNTLTLVNPSPTSYNATQKLKFLNSNFFKDDSKLIDYFDAIFTKLLSLFLEDYSNSIRQSSDLLIYSSLGLLAVGIGYVFLFWSYIRGFMHEIIEITAIFLFISYESILRNEGLKGQFLESMDDFKKLK